MSAWGKIFSCLFICSLVIFLETVFLFSGLVSGQEPTTPSSELFISEYIEGSSYNKVLEIYNPTDSPVDLAAGNYQIEIYFNGSSSPGASINLSGMLATGDVFVLADNNADPAILSIADQENPATFFNGNDAVVLKKEDLIIDVIGQIGVDPGTEWGSDLVSTADNTLVRKCDVTTGDNNGADAFDPSVEWDGYPIDTFSYLGSHDFCPPTPTPTPTETPTPTPSPSPTPPPESSPTPTLFPFPIPHFPYQLLQNHLNFLFSRLWLIFHPFKP